MRLCGEGTGGVGEWGRHACDEAHWTIAGGGVCPVSSWSDVSSESQTSLRATLSLAICWLWWAGRHRLFSLSMVSQSGWLEDAQPQHPALGVRGHCAPALTLLGVPTELPVSILRPLRDKIAIEKHRGVLECQMSRASARVRWFKGSVELQPGAKYEMVSDGLYRQLVINAVQPEDEDTYTCDAGDVKTSAQFFVEGSGRAGWAAVPFFRQGRCYSLWHVEVARSEKDLTGRVGSPQGGSEHA